ncbi:DUF998 domain-containing protein [Clostridium sporogenes]|uniref:DUF998 domain-containing protein n=1 Tax=Clostridium sporogenes TaxID=1509 RepID=UPI0013D54705|nr:DUF998 domain-containing protein [Clostridium sporogenes]EJP6471565.1 DUF998 domain-containing protein [Clostridium botulinum]NFV12384.1 DUF998 domain-containing protein [Clostridium sporogenes]
MWGSKFNWIILIIGAFLEFIIPYVLTFFYPRYSHSREVLSALGGKNSPVCQYYNLWLIIWGIIMSFTSITFYKTYFKFSNIVSIIGSIIFILFGVGACILSSIFSVEDKRSIESIEGKVHGIGSGVGFIALAFMPLIISKLSYMKGESLLGIIFIIFFIINIIIFTLFIMSEKDRFSNTLIGLSGLWQRLLLVSFYMPLVILAIKNINLS